METKTKLSIEETAEQLLIWKVKGKGEEEIPCCPAKEPKLFSKGIQNLVKKGYLVNKGNKSKPDYHVTPEGIEHVSGVEEYLHTNL